MQHVFFEAKETTQISLSIGTGCLWHIPLERHPISFVDTVPLLDDDKVVAQDRVIQGEPRCRRFAAARRPEKNEGPVILYDAGSVEE